MGDAGDAEGDGGSDGDQEDSLGTDGRGPVCEVGTSGAAILGL